MDGIISPQPGMACGTGGFLPSCVSAAAGKFPLFCMSVVIGKFLQAGISAEAGKYLCRIYGQLPVLDVLLVSGIGLWIFLFQSPAVYAEAVHRLP